MASSKDPRSFVCPTALARSYYESVADVYGSKRDDGWFSFVRRREIDTIVRLLGPRPGHWILDAGCGPGRIASLLRARGARVHGVDVSARMLEHAAPHLDAATLGDFTTIEPGRRFDAVLCAGALEFTPEPRRALHRLAGHLVDGGALVLLAPCAGLSGRIYRRVQSRRNMQVSLVAPSDVVAWASEAGLRLSAQVSPFFHCRIWKFVSR